MNEIKCPHCGEVFKVDASGYADIVKQVRDAEFSRDLDERVKAVQREGEQALDRAFGISWDAVDAPPYVARALLTQEIIAKTRRYEPRAQILRVDYDEPDLSGTLAARVTLEVTDT